MNCTVRARIGRHSFAYEHIFGIPPRVENELSLDATLPGLDGLTRKTKSRRDDVKGIAELGRFDVQADGPPPARG